MILFKHFASRRIAALLFGAFLVTAAMPVSQSLACACCGSYQVVGVAHWDVLNVRTGPGTGYRIIQRLRPGEACIVKTGERRGNWVRIQTGNGYGWVNRRFLAILR